MLSPPPPPILFINILIIILKGKDIWAILIIFKNKLASKNICIFKLHFYQNKSIYNQKPVNQGSVYDEILKKSMGFGLRSSEALV